MAIIKTLDLIADRIRSTGAGKYREVLEDCTKMLLLYVAELVGARTVKVLAATSR
ncbi:hypothetical protein QBC33DRAFT_564058 [Phialemonium atrogriseum]|uniref:Uncharacterized protein n=1 Tax=Phialemonium atrogriseum TaxID=1093897 RepID=A0AAJ0FHG1_9PEZI|nr:uncharacterized protein QBC33DRAFT_564058 [Phialemonium atrogriseum]KAK1762134.1 hypothetical protein QBC33DRAFT_564058 [Phialemonium atrogriseum]